jgi:hypothetical protein
MPPARSSSIHIPCHQHEDPARRWPSNFATKERALVAKHHISPPQSEIDMSIQISRMDDAACHYASCAATS